MAVLNDILEWSSEPDRPIWQRDALRRIVTQENVSSADIDELLSICLGNHGLESADELAANPIVLEAAHLPTLEELADDIRVAGIQNVLNVNALAANQQLSFGHAGMTIVFGYNGAGKSGYARILRAVCHARHRGEEILSDAFSLEGTGTPSATIEYVKGQQECTYGWEQGRPVPPELGNICFFDSDCAAIHVDAENELAYAPLGLDVLPKLASICRRLSTAISERIRQEEGQRAACVSNPVAQVGTAVRRLLDGLNEESDIRRFRELGNVSEAENQRIGELREVLGDDPGRRSRGLRATISRIERLIADNEIIEARLGENGILEIREKFDNSVIKSNAARAAATESFGNQPLQGVGDDSWQVLWEAARRYSTASAYPDGTFPFVGHAARCVLCQQDLENDAKERLAKFEGFIQAETQQIAEHAKKAFHDAVIAVQALSLGSTAIRDALVDLDDVDAELRRVIRRFYRIAWRVRRAVAQTAVEDSWVDPPELSQSPNTQLTGLITDLTRRAGELERVANDDARRELAAEQSELLARQWLASVIDEVESEIARCRIIAALRRAESDTTTNRITRKSGELTDLYITDVLKDQFRQEVFALGAGHLQVELDSPGGRLGQRRFKIILQGIRGNIRVGNVLSEGEFKCIALAGFLAELSTEMSFSGIVFDDPVSSLDHEWRRKVARRLVQLASERQVVIFTHDIVFLTDLVEFCRASNVPLRQNYLFRGTANPGECLDGLPWAAMSVRDRISRLRALHQDAGAIYRRGGRVAYEPRAREAYGLLRETWERAVEEVLLNGVVKRFDRAIHTQQVAKLVDITPQDVEQIDAGMTKTSRFLVGHDEAGAIGDPVPDPVELLADIDALNNWVGEVRRRRN